VSYQQYTKEKGVPGRGLGRGGVKRGRIRI